MNVEIKRDHLGKLHMYVDGIPAIGAVVTGMAITDGGPHFMVAVPTKHATLGEVGNVVPFRVAGTAQA